MPQPLFDTSAALQLGAQTRTGFEPASAGRIELARPRHRVGRNMTGSELYRRAMAINEDQGEERDLMLLLWGGTPWMVDAYVGQTGDERGTTRYGSGAAIVMGPRPRRLMAIPASGTAALARSMAGLGLDRDRGHVGVVP